MKGFYVLMFSVSAVTVGCGSADSNTEVHAQNITSEVVFEIEGMMCEHGCKGTIEKTLNGTAGVGSCSVDFESSIATVSFDKAVLSAGDILAIVDGLNDGTYSTKQIEVKEIGDAHAPSTSSTSTDEVSVSAASFSLPDMTGILGGLF